MQLFSTVALTGLVVGKAAAFGWSNAEPFSCPFHSENSCSASQMNGYNWLDLAPGPFHEYGSNTFHGWSCAESFSKRDEVMKRDFQKKVIQAKLEDQPLIKCNDNENMSINQYEMSVSQDTQFEAVYRMPDGSSCKQSHHCLASGSIIQNTQCGGAKEVFFRHVEGGSSDCHMAIHSIDFTCGAQSTSISWNLLPSSTPTLESTKSSALSVTTSESKSSTSLTDAHSTTESSVSKDTPSRSSTTTSSTSTHATDILLISKTSSSTTSPLSLSTSTIYTTSERTVYSCAPSVTDCPARNGSIADVTDTIAIATTICPVTATETGAHWSSKTKTHHSHHHNHTRTHTHSHHSHSHHNATSISRKPVATANTPELLPKCLSTWLFETKCKDNSDYTCYCKDSKFVIDVMDCIASWSITTDEAKSAAAFMMGMCAPFVAENPAIITACPSNLAPTAKATEQKVETTTIHSLSTKTFYSTKKTTITQCPSSATTCAEKTTEVITTSTPVSYRTISTHFESTITSMPRLDVAPSTITIWSTEEKTVTSCAADITNCPAKSTQVVTSSYPVSTVITTPSDEGHSAITSDGHPYTVIDFSSTVVVPATYTEGVSMGFTIPSSSITTALVTAVTVPQVALTTIAPSGSGESDSVALGYGAPPSTDAMTTPLLPTWVPLGNSTGRWYSSGGPFTATMTTTSSSQGIAIMTASGTPSIPPVKGSASGQLRLDGAESLASLLVVYVAAALAL